jgi:hypothetical protein
MLSYLLSNKYFYFGERNALTTSLFTIYSLGINSKFARNDLKLKLILYHNNICFEEAMFEISL